jgi:hypothetical protein
LNGLELDFFFPELNFAIEINGPTHYTMIYNEEKLNRTKENDKRKINLCPELGIDLFVLDIHSTRLSNEEYIRIIMAVLGGLVPSGKKTCTAG